MAGVIFICKLTGIVNIITIIDIFVIEKSNEK